jgi:hypothetical protein
MQEEDGTRDDQSKAKRYRTDHRDHKPEDWPWSAPYSASWKRREGFHDMYCDGSCKGHAGRPEAEIMNVQFR